LTTCTAVFLDLQGTLGGEGLGDILDFAFYPCAIPALRLLNENNILSIIITNQSHIAKGYFTIDQYEMIVDKLRQELSTHGVVFDGIYCCPHTQSDNCECQKPKLGLINQPQQKFGISLNESYVVGDMGSSDILMADAMGSKGILVRTGVGESSLNEYRHTWEGVNPNFVADDVLHAVEWIIQDRSIEK
jgi:D-glycero-D-manno-heptose 1,7-bisphosphate phosphatase